MLKIISLKSLCGKYFALDMWPTKQPCLGKKVGLYHKFLPKKRSFMVFFVFVFCFCFLFFYLFLRKFFFIVFLAHFFPRFSVIFFFIFSLATKRRRRKKRNKTKQTKKKEQNKYWSQRLGLCGKSDSTYMRAGLWDKPFFGGGLRALSNDLSLFVILFDCLFVCLWVCLFVWRLFVCLFTSLNSWICAWSNIAKTLEVARCALFFPPPFFDPFAFLLAW